ncbi:MAG: sigma-54 dependent transcriptional regulator [Paracoccaceae bacterium]|jgi:two-component system nitrogen regulation response regulator NtrX|nr:sigma-54 dependent transcriptional regulator [Paracoccaceae bacterium]MDP7184381.1 sigma-54 dependent transcriptional regulator [Paracoccaceae bacterium]
MNDILVVDDEKDIRHLIGDILQDEGFEPRLAGTSEDCIEAIEHRPPSLLILDIWLKDSKMDGIDILKYVKQNHPSVPVVIISGHGNIEIAVAAIKQGAYDFIEKPFNIDQLLVVIRRAMETSKLRHENIELKRKDSTVGSPMIGESASFKHLKSQLDKVTKSNGRVMLFGGSGSGKEIAARYVHLKSDRAHAPFVLVNCASVEPDRAEIMLFGQEVSGTTEPGLLEQANGGVIFFDEIADMPLGAQSKILRVLVDQSFKRVGGNKKIEVDLRVISASSRDLEALIEAGLFRQELYHRLNVVPIRIPSLEERREDIRQLAEHFIGLFHNEQGLARREISDEAITLLQTRRWPGNVRELRNLIERVLILSDGSGAIEAGDFSGTEASRDSEDRVVLSGNIATLPLREAREAFEREYLMTQINRFGGNISRTAQFVGMERSALHRKLKSLNVVNIGKKSANDAADN